MSILRFPPNGHKEKRKCDILYITFTFFYIRSVLKRGIRNGSESNVLKTMVV
jgi:hypothetical protein